VIPPSSSRKPIPRRSGFLSVLRGEVAATPAAIVWGLLAALDRWAGWRLPAARGIADPRGRVSLCTPVGQRFVVESLWSADRLLLWEAVWRAPAPAKEGGSWATRLIVTEHGLGTAVTLTTELDGCTDEREAALRSPSPDTCATPRALLEALVATIPLRVDGTVLVPRARIIGAPALTDWVSFDVEDPSRTLPIILLSAFETAAGAGTPVYAMPPDLLAAAMLGTAHVAALDSHATSFALSDLVTKEGSVYLGAARVYLPPSESATGSDWRRHPVFLPDELATADGLVRLRASVTPKTPPLWVPSAAFSALRDQRSTLIVTAASSDPGDAAATVPSAHADEVAKLRARLRTAEADRAALLTQLEALTDANDTLEDETPTVLSVLLEVAEMFADVLVVHPKAIQSASESVFDDVAALRHALTTLGTLGRTAQATPLVGGLYAAFRAHGVAYASGMSESSSEKILRQFRRTWNGVVYECAEHLSLGTSYDPRHCLRVHLSWKARTADGRILIGHCGRHLDTMTSGS
jgi:hypothetical protein